MVALLSVHTVVASEAKPNVTWAGVGFSGDWSNRAEVYPHTSNFFCLADSCEEDNSVELWARQRLIESGALQQSNFRVQLGMVDSNSLEQIGLAIAIANESVVIEKLSVAGKVSYLTNYSISGSALFFDLVSNKLIYSVPLITRYTTVYDTNPKQLEQQRVFKNMLQNNTLGLNFFDEMADRLANIQFQTKPTAYLKIANLNFDSALNSHFSEQFHLEDAQSFLATYFENVFVRETGYALIPNSVGHAVGNKIATRLPSGDLTIELPEPGYTMTVKVSKLLFQRKPGKGSDSLCWAARLEWRLQELVFGDDTIASTDIKNVNCAVVRNDSALAHDTEYMKLIMGMLETYAKQFKQTNAEWVNKYTDNPNDTRAAIETLNAIFTR